VPPRARSRGRRAPALALALALAGGLGLGTTLAGVAGGRALLAGAERPPARDVAWVQAALGGWATTGSMDGRILRVRGIARHCPYAGLACGEGELTLEDPAGGTTIALAPDDPPPPGPGERLLGLLGIRGERFAFGRVAIYAVRVWHPACPSSAACAHRRTDRALVPLSGPDPG